MGRGVKGAAGALRAGSKVRRGRQASVWRLAALFFFTELTKIFKDAVAEQNQDRYT